MFILCQSKYPSILIYSDYEYYYIFSNFYPRNYFVHVAIISQAFSIGVIWIKILSKVFLVFQYTTLLTISKVSCSSLLHDKVISK